MKKLSPARRAAMMGALLAVALFYLAGAAPGGITRSFAVRSFSPEGLVERPTQIRIDFSSDVVTSADVERRLAEDEYPVLFSPPLAGSGRWLSPSSFVYQPAGSRLASATAYTVTVREKLADVSGNLIRGKRVFEMRTPPLKVMGARQVAFDAETGVVTYEIAFSLPVSGSRLSGFLSVTDSKGAKLPFTMDRLDVAPNQQLRVMGQDGSPVTLRVEQGMTSEEGPLGLESRAVIKLDRDLALAVKGSLTISNIGGSYIRLFTSAPIDIARAAAYISVSGSPKIRLESYGSITHIYGSFKPRDRVTLKLARGLPSVGGHALKEDWERSFIVRDLDSEINFVSNGRFLSPAGERLIMPLQMVNVERVHVNVARVYDNNVPVVMLRSWPYYPDDFVENIFEKTYAVAEKANIVAERAIDLREATGGRKGLFLIVASDENGGPWTHHVVNITDIAGSARLGRRGALVWAASISQGKPLRDVDVTLWSAKHQPLASGRTDADGIWQHKTNDLWKPEQRPDFATLQLGDDISVVRFDNDIWGRSDLDLEGAGYTRGYQAMCFTPRGVFRPGERVPVEFLVRDADMSRVAPFPVRVVVFTPGHREWKSYTRTLSGMGMGTVLVELPDAAPTGAWTAEVRIPGDEASIGETRFLVEDVAPPRIAVAVSADRTSISPQENVALDISARYLFGAPADGLDYEAELTLAPRDFKHPSWPGYVFADARREFEREAMSIGSGTLSPEGSGVLRFSIRQLNPPSIVDAVIRTGVMEDGGRWVYSSTTVPYYPHPVLLGIEKPQGGFKPGEMMPFRIAAVNRDGKAAALASVKIRTFRVNYVSQTAMGDGAISEMRSELVAVGDMDLKLNEGKGETRMSFESAGEYVLAVEDPESGASASCRFYVGESYWGGSGASTLAERLEITLDKERYKRGDHAKVRVAGSYDGSVLVTVETDTVVLAASGTMKNGETEVAFRVTEEMSPNAWVTAQAVRLVAEEDEWRAHRAIGATPLLVDNASAKLAVKITSPERLKPRARNDFSVTLTDASGKGVAGEVVVMLVDEGVLGLTRYSVPSPFEYFTSRRGLAVSAYDIYDLLIPIDRKAWALLKPGGGEGEDMMYSMAQASLSPVRANRFKILTLHKRIVTDNAGRADFSFVLPEFSGGARLMAVAASAGAFGSFETGFEVARDVVSELYLPRAAAPGDAFTAAVQLFNRSAVSRDVTWRLEVSGPVSADRVSGTVPLAPAGAGAAVIPIGMKAAGDSGVVEARLVTSWGGGGSSQVVEMAVRPPYPRVSQTNSIVIEPGKSQIVTLPGKWLPGTRRGAVVASGKPQIQLADLARFLIEYPYSCLEQTVSSGWALLASPQLAAGVDPGLATPRAVSMALGEHLRQIQSLQLYNGAFAAWPGGVAYDSQTEWNTAYTAHFLTACEAARVQTPGTTLRSARVFLNDLIVRPPDIYERRFSDELTVRAYACYVLSLGGEPPVAWINYLKDNAGEMTASGRLLLAAACARAGEKDFARRLVTDTAAPAAYSPSGRESPNMDSDLRTLALRLMAWNELDPKSPQAASAARNVLGALRATSQPTTQEAAFALFNLSTYFQFNDEQGDARIEISPKLFETASGDMPSRGVISEDIARLTLKNGGTARGYVSWTVDGVPTEAPTPEDKGIRARVRYLDSSGNTIDMARGVVRGAKVIGVVTLEPVGEAASNVVVSLPMAGGLELEGSSKEGDTRGLRSELRDDRLLLFVDKLNDMIDWRFTMRAVTAGDFALPPIAAEGMYSPAIRSVTAAGRIIVREN